MEMGDMFNDIPSKFAPLNILFYFIFLIEACTEFDDLAPSTSTISHAVLFQ